MLFTDEEDASLKTHVVRPNDILGIKISPLTNVTLSRAWQYNSNGKEAPQGTQFKPKFKGKKVTGDHCSYGSMRVQPESSMKRGDPFLPSVFPDENPIADYNVKKNSRKKPSDCKCKGFGYNLSPSALLPEEMRQQWGSGVFGKPTLSRPNVISSSTCSSSRDNEPSCVQPSVVRAGDTGSGTSCCVIRCKTCMKDPCLCSEMCSKHDGFRIPETSLTRKHKSSTKGVSTKGRGNNATSMLIGSTNNVSVLKRVTFYNSKDNNNIISTSNFHRNSASSLNGHGSPAAEWNAYRMGMSGAQGSSGFSRPIMNGSQATSTNKFSYTTNDDFAAIPRDRQLHQPIHHRHHALSPPLLSTTAGLRVPQGLLEVKAVMSRGPPPMLVLGGQGCTCDSCRQRSNLMSKMEKLGFSPSRTQHMLPPLMIETCKQYQSGGLRSVLATPGRYAPYNVPTYGYAHMTRNVYSSPERHQYPSPPFYDYIDLPSVKGQPLTSTPLSKVYEMSKTDNSFLDNDSSANSPPFSGFGEDIIDLSIKDTVDFFVSMKSPFVTFSLATSDTCPETCSSHSSGGQCSPHSSGGQCSSQSSGGQCSSHSSGGQCSTVSPVEQCSSPGYSNNSTSWFSTAGVSSYSVSSVQQDNLCRSRSSAHQKQPGSGQMQSISLLYSSLVSDLEDELLCAIENIPTS